ncbi:hypothetical protein [Pseudomonas typographi]|uniref:Uncharacterized protein n=1 Tax=Pseudomonas typographi TaxID=2715964 RepID=A0ABR7Z458_9PSED|nr:hypothetical protein [Pseudomonas typographi]MBD1588284.1 hypothetical protein [Pseudomonas typographi]MBD1600255.1 hypothetical protein [Pseudomonas typographi]
MPINANSANSAALRLYASVKDGPRSNRLSRILKGAANSVRTRKSTELLVIKHQDLSKRLDAARKECGGLVGLGKGHPQGEIITTVRSAVPKKRPIIPSLSLIKATELNLEKNFVVASAKKKLGKLKTKIGKYEKELQTIDNKINKRAIIKSER